MILWTEQFETGSEQLDQQHRMLIDHINLLEVQLQNPSPNREERAFAVHLVDYLEAYANVHFKDEEKCMESHRCAAHAQNRREHERFRGFIHNYKTLCELEGFKLDLLKNLHELIRTWIQDHILKVDTQLRRCIPPFSQSGSDPAP